MERSTTLYASLVYKEAEKAEAVATSEPIGEMILIQVTDTLTTDRSLSVMKMEGCGMEKDQGKNEMFSAGPGAQ